MGGLFAPHSSSICYFPHSHSLFLSALALLSTLYFLFVPVILSLSLFLRSWSSSTYHSWYSCFPSKHSTHADIHRETIGTRYQGQQLPMGGNMIPNWHGFVHNDQGNTGKILHEPVFVLHLHSPPSTLFASCVKRRCRA